MNIRTMLTMLMGMGMATTAARAGVLQYGDSDLLGTGRYSSSPTAGATLEGLKPGAATTATDSFSHVYPFSPAGEDFAGTDQIYANGTAAQPRDGYSGTDVTTDGPQVLTMDYRSLVPAGARVETMTLGIAADDFQDPIFQRQFVAKINGVVDSSLSNQLNSMDLSGPTVRYFSIGLDPSLLTTSNVLALSIDRDGPRNDGWAVDFTTIGVTTSQAVPEPSTLYVTALGFMGLACCARRRRVRHGLTEGHGRP